MLINAKNKNLFQTTSGLPDPSGAVMRNLQNMIFENMQRRMIDGRMQSIPIKNLAMASKQPFTAKELKVLPTGDRAWTWYKIHSLTNLLLNVNDRVKINGEPFKVMKKWGWNDYGFWEYDIIEDVIPVNSQVSNDDSDSN